jgi:hypothetical protein
VYLLRKILLVLAVLAMAAMIVTPAMASTYTAQDWENFSMSNGNLVGQTPGFTAAAAPTWGAGTDTYDTNLTAAGSEISVVNHALQVSTNSAGKTTTARWTKNTNLTGGVTFQFSAKAGTYTGTDVDSWSILVGLPSNAAPGNNRQYVKWVGNSSSVKCYDVVTNAVLATVTLTDTWQQFTAVGSGGPNATYYYAGTTLIGTSAGDAAHNANLRWVTVQSLYSASGSSNVNLDYFNYGFGTTPVPEPSSVMALGMFGLGALGFMKRRRA